ncbi:MAG: ribosome small subunit-dependent GTPase A [Planctomycetales bacterium]
MAKKNKKKKIRLQLRKNQQTRTREKDLTRRYETENLDEDKLETRQRVTGKGDLTRKRTVVGEEVDDGADGTEVVLSVDESVCRPGRVLTAMGLNCSVQDEQGAVYQCTTRRLLKTLSSDQRHVVVTGDRVLFQPLGEGEGVIERVEPRRGILSRTSRERRHILVANVDQLLIVVSADDPPLKPNLVDRYLISAEQGGMEPVVCVNKLDLVNPADLQPLTGLYSQLGYRVLPVCAMTGFGLGRLRGVLKDRETVVSGQSGVGKSSLLNAVESGLGLRVTSVSDDGHKGRHTTTAATLYPLSFGGYVADTPGIRQFGLWDVVSEEVAGYFREMRPFINHCRFPNCTHTHEADCGVKDAVADMLIDARRYESYLHLLDGDFLE